MLISISVATERGKRDQHLGRSRTTSRSRGKTSHCGTLPGQTVSTSFFGARRFLENRGGLPQKWWCFQNTNARCATYFWDAQHISGMRSIFSEMRNIFYVPERPFMHLIVCCWFLISSGWGGEGKVGSRRREARGPSWRGRIKGVEGWGVTLLHWRG